MFSVALGYVDQESAGCLVFCIDINAALHDSLYVRTIVSCSVRSVDNKSSSLVIKALEFGGLDLPGRDFPNGASGAKSWQMAIIYPAKIEKWPIHRSAASSLLDNFLPTDSLKHHEQHTFSLRAYSTITVKEQSVLPTGSLCVDNF